MDTRRRALALALPIICAITFCSLASSQVEPAAAAGYHPAPQAIHDILSAPPTPLVLVSPKGDRLLVGDRLQYPPIADLAQPMLRLAGLRINSVTNGRHHPPRFVSLRLYYTQGNEHADVKAPKDA